MSRSLVCSLNRGLATVRTVATRAVHRLRGRSVVATLLLGDGGAAREAHAALVVDADALDDDLVTDNNSNSNMVKSLLGFCQKPSSNNNCFFNNTNSNN